MLLVVSKWFVSPREQQTMSVCSVSALNACSDTHPGTSRPICHLGTINMITAWAISVIRLIPPAVDNFLAVYGANMQISPGVVARTAL